MTSLNTLSGFTGKMTVVGTQVARTTRWSVNPKLAHVSEWGDSDSAGYTNRKAGRLDCLFNAEGKFDITNEFYNLFDLGDTAAVKLFMTNALFWNFPRALNVDYKLVVDMDKEDVIGWTSDWGSDGPFYRPGETG